MAGAELHDLGALSELRAALVRFREQTRDVPDLLRQRTSRARQDIARRHQLLTAMIAELESEDETEDSDQAERERQLDRLRHQLGRVEACEATLDAAAGAHDLALRQWHPVMERTLPSAIAFLSSKHAEAVESLRVALPGTGAASRHQGLKPGDGASSAAGTIASEAPRSSPIDARSADELPALPAGFVWAPISQFDQPELPGRNDFRKGVSYEEMSGGVQRLWAEMMPLLRGAPDAGSAACAEFDKANGRIDPRGFAHPASLADLWGHFFGRKEYVRLEIDRSGRWCIVNGRHRISVARDLGWKFIPAEVVDVSAGASGP